MFAQSTRCCMLHSPTYHPCTWGVNSTMERAKHSLARTWILGSVLALAALITGCSLHYTQTTDGQTLDIEVLRSVPVGTKPAE